MLRLLQHLSTPNPQSGLVGILEDRRQLQRRMQMIAIFAPKRRSFAAAGLLTILAIVGLTDAQVAPTLSTVFPSAGAATPATSPGPVAIPQPTGPYVLFLVNGSETMLGEFNAAVRPDEKKAIDYRERGRIYAVEGRSGTDEQKRAAPKWRRTVQMLEQMLNALPAETNFHVALFFDDRIERVAGRIDPNDQQAIPNTIARLRVAIPRGAANLESAFGFVTDVLNAPRPERIVLITDGLPTTSSSSPSEGEITEAQRIRYFQLATKRLPPRIPVHIVLLPLPPGDPAAPGLYWELANATRGGLTCPANPRSEPRTHLAFVIDTSGSMRDPNRGGLWPIVIDTIEATLDAHPQLAGVQLLDGDGRFILGRRGNGAAGWLPNAPATRESIKRVLSRYDQDSISNPIPGIYNAIRFLQDKDASGLRMGIYVLGDEYTSSDPAGAVLDRLDALNPRNTNGRRPITISAIGFPTTIRYQFSMGNTGLRFANLMRLLTYDHDGTFVALPDL
ncbi:MAG: VWA domain-containing protein [Verrucomicrobia bacterium]|nr:VWA domain-containing protein [Verrucomicrobiota bacterium]